MATGSHPIILASYLAYFCAQATSDLQQAVLEGYFFCLPWFVAVYDGHDMLLCVSTSFVEAAKQAEDG